MTRARDEEAILRETMTALCRALPGAWRARKTHVFGSATFTYARRSPPRLCLVRTRTVPIGNFCSLAMMSLTGVA